MSIGLIALFDDIAALTKAAAASFGDIAGQAAKAGAKAAGVVIDDAAVTPRYVVGVAAARELSIIRRIAAGSLRNKLLVLLPAALALSLLAPWAVTPLLILGGAYLCYEGAQKVYETGFPQRAREQDAHSVPLDASALEDQKVSSAIKTDLILSAEIMAITLAAVSESSFVIRASVLAFVGIGITAVVYGSVALIVKADDIGMALATTHPTSPLSGVSRAIGRGLVIGMPLLLRVLCIVGTAAMIWVGGGIIVHGLEQYDVRSAGRVIHDGAEIAARALPPHFGALVEWSVATAGYGFVGLLIGMALIPVSEYILLPAWQGLHRLREG